MKCQLLQDPTTDHLNLKIIIWLLSTVLTGIVLYTVLPDPGEKYSRGATRSEQLRFRHQGNRNAKRKEAI
jgi:hypothetical protein